MHRFRLTWRASLKRSYLLRIKYRRGMLRASRPDDYPEQSWRIDTNVPNAMRRAWLSKQVVGTVLDVGCNHGYASCVMALAADEVTALDTDPAVLVSARNLARQCGIRGVSFAIGDAYRLPFDDRSFDTVTLLEILEHLERPHAAVGEALRVARQRVIITVPAKGYMTNTVGHIQDFDIDDIVAMLPHASYACSHPPFTFVMYEKLNQKE
jgi:2-polyprenyl-3-methyl-5-hydroxy-6-metoxy-1,4-benzoquinol methylase